MARDSMYVCGLLTKEEMRQGGGGCRGEKRQWTVFHWPFGCIGNGRPSVGVHDLSQFSPDIRRQADQRSGEMIEAAGGCPVSGGYGDDGPSLYINRNQNDMREGSKRREKPVWLTCSFWWAEMSAQPSRRRSRITTTKRVPAN